MLKIFSRYIPIKSILLLITENLWITATLAFLVELRSRYLLQQEDLNLAEIAWKVALITLLCQISLFYNEVYDLSVVHTRRELVIRALQSFGAGAIVLGLLYSAFPALMIGNGVVVAFVVLAVLVLLGWRAVISAASRFYEVPRRILLVGTGDLAVDLLRGLEERPDLNMQVIGVLGDSPEAARPPLVNAKMIGTTADLEEIAERQNVDRVVVALPDRRDKLPVRALLNLKLRGVIIDDAHSLYEKLTGKIRTTALPMSWLVFSDGFHAVARKVRRKQVLDFFLALTVGVLALPIAVVVAILIKLDSCGPVLFSQERVGFRGRVFRLFKFRTMRLDAEAEGVPQWATEDDPRVTRVGRFLRQARLDEIPQIWNVLLADMSFVGPRPERPYFVEMLREKLPYYDERHSVRPGITGWAQIHYHYGATVEDALEKLQYDLFYIKNLSLFLDLAVVFQTGKIVLFGRGR